MTARLSVLLLCLSVFASVVAGDNKTEENGSGYDTRFDNIDLNDMLKNDRLRKNYVKCLLNEGPCTPDGQELKSNNNNFTSNNNNNNSTNSRSGGLCVHPNTQLTDFLCRLTSRRDSDRLLKVFGETKKRFGHRDTLFDR